jgi:hypothetical protein
VIVTVTVVCPVWKTENTAVGILHADHVAPSIRRSVGVVPSWIQATEFNFFNSNLYVMYLTIVRIE